MSETKHSPEPWECMTEGRAFGHPDPPPEERERERWCLVVALEDDPPLAYFEDEGDARRAALCVNACAGFPTEALEAGALAKALGAAVDILEHTDPGCDEMNCETKHALLAALRALGRLHTGYRAALTRQLR